MVGRVPRGGSERGRLRDRVAMPDGSSGSGLFTPFAKRRNDDWRCTCATATLREALTGRAGNRRSTSSARRSATMSKPVRNRDGAEEGATVREGVAVQSAELTAKGTPEGRGAGGGSRRTEPRWLATGEKSQTVRDEATPAPALCRDFFAGDPAPLPGVACCTAGRLSPLAASA